MAEEFTDRDLREARFERVDLRESRFRDVGFDGAVMTGVFARSLVMDGELESLVYNGIDVIPLWRDEMVRRHPDHGLLKPTTADGYREVWALL
jgi:hypothetical protein